MMLCALCGENPAAVFTPKVPLCKPCHRDAKLREQEDNVIDNFEYDELGDAVAA